MKRAFYLLALSAIVLLTACHSNEKNYREAYEKAVERRVSGYGAEAYAEIEAERQRNTTVINGDSVRLVYVNANVAEDSADVAKTYNVVVASFTQRINAKSYRDRLRQECGFPSYILYGGSEKLFYVVLQGFEDKEEAALLLRDIDRKVCLKVLERKPWILRKL
ncbi:MAG: SPOR domain-containing protein [Muribaculaceae bacterium]|nr:SPOR domain-containing protein [Muribaculaceae bacterium]